MKKLFFTIAFLCTLFVVNAEEYKAFRVDVGLGFAKPSGGGGVLFAVEPKYAITPNISAGFRMEGALMAKINWEYDNITGKYVDGGSTEVKANGSYLLTGDYHFTTNKFRPFAGLGLGVYTVAGASVDSNVSSADDVNVDAQNNFGFMLRAGFDVSHIRLAAEYNFAGKDSFDKSYNYLGIKFSVYIGGGIK